MASAVAASAPLSDSVCRPTALRARPRARARPVRPTSARSGQPVPAAAAAAEPGPCHLSLTAIPLPLRSQMLGPARRARAPRPTHALALGTAQRGDSESAGPRRSSGSTSWCDRRFEPLDYVGLLDGRAAARLPSPASPPRVAHDTRASPLRPQIRCRDLARTARESRLSWLDLVVAPPDGHAPPPSTWRRRVRRRGPGRASSGGAPLHGFGCVTVLSLTSVHVA